MIYCDNCLQPAETVAREESFSYEYGSENSTHTWTELVTVCCGDEPIRVSDDVDADVIARYVQRYNQLPTRIL
jgi:hypothetical protein